MNFADPVEIECSKGHSEKVSLDDLSEILESCTCPECGAEIAAIEPREIEIECVNCLWSEHADWKDISLWLDQSCPRCSPHLERPYPLRIVGSHGHQIASYEEFGEIKNANKLLRNGRADYWELCVHFCQEPEFLSILEAGVIRAARIGYFRLPAVCFTEIPLSCSDELCEKQGGFGLAFRKSTLLKHKGAPVQYQTDALIKAQMKKGFCVELQPFINLLRIPSIAPSNRKSSRFDFLHEREWRISSDVQLKVIKCEGLIIPDEIRKQRFRGKYGRLILDYASRYGEIRALR
jgi:hypothetical protein